MGNELCNGCPALRREEWPKGAQAARCMDKGNSFGYGRTLTVASLGTVGRVYRPAWCRKEKQ